eukprot:3786358-Pyramimonas_sp.AAC.1
MEGRFACFAYTFVTRSSTRREYTHYVLSAECSDYGYLTRAVNEQIQLTRCRGPLDCFYRIPVSGFSGTLCVFSLADTLVWWSSRIGDTSCWNHSTKSRPLWGGDLLQQGASAVTSQDAPVR